MSEEWKQPAPLWVRAMPLALVVVGIVVAFVYGERERTKKQFEEELVVVNNGDGTPQVVYIETPHVTAAHWERIASLKSLRGVDLSKAVTIDEGIEQLTSLPDLQSLTMSGGAYVDDALIQRFTGLPTLKRLIVSGCPGVTDASVDVLIGWESLEGVDLAGTSITVPGLARLREARRDLLLVASAARFYIAHDSDGSGAQTSRIFLPTPADVEIFKAVLVVPHNWRSGRWQEDPKSQFENLEVYGEAAGAALPELASVLDNVKSLSVTDTRITDVGTWSDALTSLNVSAPAAGSDLSGFARCRSLTSIRLNGYHYNYQTEETEVAVTLDLQWLGELPNLRELHISYFDPAAEDLEAISRVTSLETLYLNSSACKTIDPLLSPGRMPNLNSLSLYGLCLDVEAKSKLQAAHPGANIDGDFITTVAAESDE